MAFKASDQFVKLWITGQNTTKLESTIKNYTF